MITKSPKIKPGEQPDGSWILDIGRVDDYFGTLQESLEKLDGNHVRWRDMETEQIDEQRHFLSYVPQAELEDRRDRFSKALANREQILQRLLTQISSPDDVWDGLIARTKTEMDELRARIVVINEALHAKAIRLSGGE